MIIPEIKLEFGLKNGITRINCEEERKTPKQDLWFERDRKVYLEDIYPDC
jgi:hypothetical protein